MADTDIQPQRKRARQACVACNNRRVKCNVTESQPCQNCLASGTSCETRESRRGKHARPSKKRQSEDLTSVLSDNSQHADEVAASHALASLYKDRPTDSLNPAVVGLDSLAQSHIELGPRQDSRPEEDGDVFLGESTALRYVHDQPISAVPPGVSPSHNVRLRHAVPNAVRADALIPEWEVERRRNRINYLRADGAFSFPQATAVDDLLKAYFQWFHPCFAVVDEADAWNQHRQGKLSPLLLQAMLFIGVLHCEERTLVDLGFGSRHKAKFIFYNRAKDIYDAEYETKKITVIQALFLMSFWRAGALLEKDTRHWLGAAITLAQSKALHRSAGKAETQAAKLRKRIWWSLYTRDRQCAAALGLPNRIRDEDCDFEPLDLSDYECAFGAATPTKEAEEYASYAVGMTELARLLGNIVHSGYLPNKILTSYHRAQMRDELDKWKARLSPAMQPDNDGEQPSFLANMQHLAYNNLLVLLYRQGFIGSEEESRDIDGSIALQAAARNTRIIEDMLSAGNLRHAQVHVITNLFNTLCVHTLHLRQSDGTTRTVAEHRAKLCLTGLQELQKTWEVTNWVLQLFFQYLDRATAARLRVQQEDESTTGPGTRVLHEQIQAPQLQQLAPRAELAPRSQQFISVPESDVVHSLPDATAQGETPFSWTSEEANSFLFSQIQNEFAFGEGEMVDWNSEEAAYSNALFQPADIESQFLR